MSKRTMVEDALFQIQNLEEALNKNAEGILASTMKEEIKSLVKESLNEQDDEVEDVADEDEVEDVVMIDDEPIEPMDDEGDVPMPPMADFDDDDDETIDLTKASDAEVIKVFKLMGDDDGIVVTKDDDSISIVDGEDEYLIKLNEEIEEEMNKNELDEWDSDETIEWSDIEAALDKLKKGDEEDEEDEDYEEGEEDELDETLYELELDEDDMGPFDPDDTTELDEILYELHMDDDLEEDDFKSLEMDEDAFGDDDYEDYEEGELDETLYELEMDEDDSEDDYMLEGEKSKVSRKGLTGKGPKFSYKGNNTFKKGFEKKVSEGPKKPKTSGKQVKYSWKEEVNMGGFGDGKKIEANEASRTYGAGKSHGKGGLNKPKTYSRKVRKESIDGEVNLLREKNEEYKKALDLFRTKLNEVAIFNSNLAYATRLFTEHSTTKQEKINILRRFDNVDTLKESKNLYRSIKNELSEDGLGDSVQINETIERVVSKTPSTGSATNLIESKTYENPQFLRMKDLMTKIK